MGAEQAIVSTSPGTGGLQGFADQVVAKIHLAKHKKWLLLGRVVVLNEDGDRQPVTAKLVHDATIVVDQSRQVIPFLEQHCIHLQTPFELQEGKSNVITLECNTFDGSFTFGSLIALQVDDIDIQ